MRLPNGTIVVQEGQELSVCVELETTLPGGIASDLIVSLFANTESGT